MTRIDKTTLHTAASVRFLNLGVNADAYTALDNDDQTGVEALEIDEFRLRFDYLIDVADMDVLTIIPFFETSFYPAKGDARTYNGVTADPTLRKDDWEEEPYWVGADAWYKLPTPVWKLEPALPEMLVVPPALKARSLPVSLSRWAPLILPPIKKSILPMAITATTSSALIALSLTNAELGLTVTIPVPVEECMSAYGAGHLWLDSKSRDVVARDSVLVGGISVSFRLSEIGR